VTNTLGPAHPGRRVARTILANLGAFAVAVPVIVAAIGLPDDSPTWVLTLAASVVAVSAAITRVLAVPQVDQFLQHTLSWLAAGDVSASAVVAVEDKNGLVVAGPAAPEQNGTPVNVVPAEVEDLDTNEEF